MKQPNSSRTTGRPVGPLGGVLTLLLVIMLMFGVVGSAMAAPVVASNSQAAATQLSLVGPATNPHVGETFDVQVNINNVTDLGAYTVKLSFDSARMQVVSVTGVTAFLAPPAIQLTPPPPPAGTVTFGAISTGGVRPVPACWLPSSSRR